jgi:hypothetical protein
MPGQLATAVVSPATNVLPQGLCTSFVEIQQFPLLVQDYHDSTIERSLVTDTVNPPRPLRTWRLAKRVTTAQLTALLTFWEVTVSGGLNPFYFYDPFAAGVTPIGSNYDATGVSTTGRVTVFFRGDWQHALGIGRGTIPNLELLETL